MIRAREDRWFDRFRHTGDPRLLAKVFDRAAPELWRVAAHLCRNQHAAEDAVQGTFLTAIEAKDSWDAARPLLPWLLGLLANRVRENRRRAAHKPDAERVAVAPRERDPAELAEHGEFGVAFRTALARIAEPFREALERHLVHGHAAHEIAAELGVPAGTVRMRLHRGLDQLRQKLPRGFFAGGAVALQLPLESFAAMRQVVLTAVPGGAAVAAIGSGHVVLGVIGVLLMKKTMLAVVAGLVLGLGVWSLWPEVGGATEVAPGVPAIVAMTVRPLTPTPNDAAPALPEGTERTAVGPVSRAAAKGRLRVVLRHGGTGAPVRERLQVQAGFRPDGGTRTSTPGDLQFGETDAQGVAAFTLPVGKAKVSSSILLRGKPVEAEIVADAETELAVTLPVQLAAEVEVVDSRGQPLAGARILGRTREDLDYLVERELGRTGADGRWREQFLESGVPIRATCDGYVASAPTDLHAMQPRARLMLAEGPAVVGGTVFGTDGRPMQGAQVAIQPRVPGVAGQRPLALVADAQGHYESAHVPPGAITVFASQQLWQGGFLTAGAFRTARTDAVVEAGGRQQIDVRFGTGARLVVALTGPDGRPVAEQEVTAVWWPEREVDAHFASMATGHGQTDANGICTIEGLLPGHYEVQVFGATWRRQEKLTLVEGQEHRLDWSMAPLVDIEVQVVDEAQAPLAGWRVALNSGEGPVREADTDRDGLVKFLQVADEAYEVSVQQRVRVVCSAYAKVTKGQRTVVAVSKAAMPTAAIHGTVQLPAGTTLASVRAELGLFEDPDRGSMWQALQEPGGTFRFTNLPAGIYELAFRRESDREYLGLPQRVDVAAAADVDVGTIVLRGPTDLRVDVACTDGGKMRDLFVGAAMLQRPRYFGTPRFTADERGATMQGVPAGRFELLVWGADIAPLFLPVVVAGEPVRVSVAPQRAVPTTFRIIGLPVGHEMTKIAFRQQGVELLSERLRESAAPVRGFLPGTYRIEVDSKDGLRGAAEFTVGSSPGPVVEVRVAK